MDSSQRPLQTYGKLFSNFEFVLEFLAKNKTFSKGYRGLNIDQIAMCYASMDSFQQALQINEKLLSNFKLFFEILAENRKLWLKTQKYSKE